MTTSKSKLIFDHIPKTAGVSLEDAIKIIFINYKRADQISNPHRLVVDRSWTGGHLYFFPNERLSKEHYYCTLLRDPVERFISQYYFNRQVATDLLANNRIYDIHLTDHHVLTSLRLPINEYIQLEGPIRDTYSNVQALHFAARMVDAPHALNEDDLVDAAIASLEGYDLIGSFENLQGFVDAVARDFNKETVPLSRLNVTRQSADRENIPQNVLDILAQANTADHKVMQWAAQRFGWKADRVPRLNGKVIERVTKAGVFVEESNPTADVGFGDKRIHIIAVRCHGADSGSMAIATGEDIVIDIDIEATIPEHELTIGIAIRDREDRLVYGVNSLLLGNNIDIKNPGTYQARITLANSLGLGTYSVTLALHKDRSHTAGCYHWLDNAAAFAIAATNGQIFEGLLDCRANIVLLSSAGHG